MKRIITLSVLALITLFAKAQDYTQLAGKAFTQNDVYTLRSLCADHAAEIDPVLLAMSKPIVSLTFNRNEEAAKEFNELLTQHAEEIGLNNLLQMVYLACRNFEVMQEYGNAADLCQQIISIVESLEQVPNEMADGFRSNRTRYLELAKHPAMTIDEHPDGLSIPFSIETFGPQNRSAQFAIQGTLNGQAAKVVFDTGAGVNIITPAYAERYGLKLIDTSTTIQGSGSIHARMAIAESLNMGDMQLHNVLFAVTDKNTGNDEADKVAEATQIIVGSAVLRLMQEMTIDLQSNIMTVPAVAHEYDEPNITFSPNNFLLLARCMHNGEPIDMNIDTGNTREWAHLDAGYYAAHKTELDAITEVEENRLAGLGGVTTETMTVLRDFTLSVGGKDCVLPKVLASKQANDQSAIAKSALGVKFFCQQNKVTLSVPYSKIMLE